MVYLNGNLIIITLENIRNKSVGEIVKLDFSFKAGNWFESSKLESLMAASMISEGTSGKSAREIADRIDFYGAQLNSLP